MNETSEAAEQNDGGSNKNLENITEVQENYDDLIKRKKSVATFTIEEEEAAKSINENTRIAPQSYQMRPCLSEAFKGNKIKEIIQKTLWSKLQGKTYSLEEARIWTREISDTVNSSVRLLNMRRYKHVVQVALGQHLGSGCSYIARCRWDAECDSQTSDVFSNSSMFCVCTVFGIYLY